MYDKDCLVAAPHQTIPCGPHPTSCNILLAAVTQTVHKMLFLEQTQGFHTEDGNACRTPSLFELLMQDRMAAGFKPAVEYLVTALCESYPRLALSLPVRRFDEAYALLRYCMEKYFLSRYDSLATEKFYGIKRVTLIENKDAMTTTGPLTPRARTLALFFAVRRERRRGAGAQSKHKMGLMCALLW